MTEQCRIGLLLKNKLLRGPDNTEFLLSPFLPFFFLFKDLIKLKLYGIYSVHTSTFNVVIFPVSLVFSIWFLETGSQHVAQAGLELVM